MSGINSNSDSKVSEDPLDKIILEKKGLNSQQNETEFHSDNNSAKTSSYDFGPSGHIKSYIVDNQDGALSRYMMRKKDNVAADYVEERIRNVEGHLGITSPTHYPSDVYARLKVIEDKIMRMEELYPQISAHLLNYQERADGRVGGRVTRAPGFYKELMITKRKKVAQDVPLNLSLDAAQASDILRSKMEDLKNKLMK